LAFAEFSAVLRCPLILQDQYWYNVRASSDANSEGITGKWLIFGPTEELHALLPRINELVESGALRAAKVARKLPGIDPFPDVQCVMCAYTSDDPAEKDRVRNLLVEEFRFEISIWKSDAQTRRDWDDGGWLRMRFEMTEIRRTLASSAPAPMLVAARERLEKLTLQLQKTLSEQPDQLTEAQHSGLKEATAALKKAAVQGSDADLAARVLLLETQLNKIVERLTDATNDIQNTSTDMNSVFVIMPFSESQVDTYDAIQRAVQKADSQLKAMRVDEKPGAIAITDEIHSSIRSAALVICDLTEERPNVYYELGFAKGIGRPLICIAREGTKVHFDVYGLKTIFFGTLRSLEERLTSEISALIKATLNTKPARQAKA
jgi:hypothetical protein